MLYLLPFCLLNHYWHPTSVTQTSQCFHGPQCISPHFHSGTNLMADVVARNAQTLILNWKIFFHCCCFPIFNEPCAPAYIWSLLKKRGKMVGDNERERRMMGKDNRAASRDDWPSQTVCLCVLQPQATRLDCNNNNADISLAPLFIACTHTHTLIIQVRHENGRACQIISLHGKYVSLTV